VARYQRDNVGTRETQSVPQRVCNTKPMNGKALQMTLWESDQPIVPRKQGNACGGKGLAEVRWDGRDTSSTLRGGQRMSTKLSSLTLRARENPKCKFTSLAHLLTEDFLLECFRELKKDKAPGIDGVTVKEYEVHLEENIKDLVGRLRTKRYRPQPLRRVYIPKPNGDKRPLGIPAVEDKIVQIGIKKILEAIYECDFLDVSYGFRPNRSCHDALDVLDKVIMTKPVNFVVDTDIEKFFDTVDHKWLMDCLMQRIADLNLLRLIARFLRSGVMVGGKYLETGRGTPQGGVLSPILANIYLHYILDLWFEKKVKKQLKGFAQLVRYADDFIVCFQYGNEAEAFGEALKQRLSKFGLRIAEEKSRIIKFGRYAWEKAQKQGEKVATFDFLGFTHYCDKTRRGKFKLGQRTARSKFRQEMKTMNQWLKDVRNLVKLAEWWQVLRKKLLGYYQYYGISGNIEGVRRYYSRTLRLAYKWINRRSQKRSYNWEQFYRFLENNPLPKPRIYHLTYTLSSY
jgi:group II intron reverse transcriptase/maturase